MAETAKSHNRKQEFLTTALELFYTKGYEHTTIQDIIDRMEVSKGAFYHYFESKEDVIISIAKDYSDRAVRIMKQIIDRADLNAVEKLNVVFSSINEYKYREREWRNKFKDAVKSAENLKLQNKLIYYMKRDAIDLFEELFIKGKEEGVIGDPVNTAEMADFFLNTIFSLNIAVDELEDKLFDNVNKLDYQVFLERLDQKVRFYETMFERILQLKEESIDLRTAYMIRIKGLE